MGKIRMVVFFWTVMGLALLTPEIATAQLWEVDGTLGPGDPTFNRPSTSFPPCTLSGNGTAVYYDVYTDYFPGGYALVEMDGTVDRPVIASYPAGTFDPANPCDDIYSVGGCITLPITVVSPLVSDGGFYDLVVTTCYNGASGSYHLSILAFLFMDGFEGGDLTEWSFSTGGQP